MRRLSSSGVPSATIRPRSRTAMRSASWSASSRYCVVRKIVTPSAARSRMISHIVRRLRGSRPVVGSSRKITCGEPTSVIARSSRRRIPPEYVDTGLPAASTRSNRSSSSATRRPSGVAAEVVQVGHQPQVLLAGEQLVHRRELARDTDRGSHPVRIAGHVVTRDAHLARRRRGSASTGSARSSSCRRRSARAERRPCPPRSRGRCRRGRPRRRTPCAGP